MNRRLLLTLFLGMAALTGLVSSRPALAVYFSLPKVANQKDGSTCGQNVATRVLLYYGVSASLEEVIASCPRSIELPFFVAGPTPLQLAACMNQWSDGVQFEAQRVASLFELKAELVQRRPVILLIQPRKFQFTAAWYAARFFSSAFGYGGLAGFLNDSTFAKEYGLSFESSEIPSVLQVPGAHYVVINGWYPLEREFQFVESLNGKEYRVSEDVLARKWFWEAPSSFSKKILDALQVQGGMMIVLKPKADGPAVDWPFRRLFPKL